MTKLFGIWHTAPMIRPRHRLSSSRLRVALRQFTVLALESSADDTCAAVVTSSRQILSNVVLRQNHV
jgi:N6-L-threonylcarbamoyladenine synthase